MPARPLEKYVRRYTTLSSALDTLKYRRLILLSPSRWDDTNDAHTMELYKTQRKLGAVVALCCTLSTETYHHWRVFTQGIDGICLEFDREKLQRAMNNLDGVRASKVEYKTILRLSSLSKKDANKFPFIKRDAYSDEREWRIISEHIHAETATCEVPIDLGWLNRIVINPWMPDDLVETTRLLMREIAGPRRLSIVRSTLTRSKAWKDASAKLLA
jgi:Protein of unknown function (DUF2971)